MRTYRMMIGLLISLAVLVLAGAAAEEDEGVRLKFLGPDGAPVSGARFTVVPRPFLFAEDEDPDLFAGQTTNAAGVVKLKARQPLLNEGTEILVQVNSETTGLFVFMMARGRPLSGYDRMRMPERAIRKGRVCDESGQPVAGVSVTPMFSPESTWAAVPAAASSVLTDAEGRFEVQDYPASHQAAGLCFLKEGVGAFFWPEMSCQSACGADSSLMPEYTETLDWPPGMPIPEENSPFQLKVEVPDIEVILKRGKSLRGQVLHRDTGEPVAGAIVRRAVRGGILFPCETAITDEQGRYAFNDMSISRVYNVSVNASGGLRGFGEVAMLREEAVTEAPTLLIGPPSVIAGQIVEEALGRYLPEREVRLHARGEGSWRGGSEADIREDGSFEIRTSAGLVTLSAIGINCAICEESREQRIILEPGGRREGLRILTRPWKVLKGKVVRPDGTPGAGAEVTIRWRSEDFGPVIADTTGVFEVALPDACFERNENLVGGMGFHARLDCETALLGVKRLEPAPAEEASCEIELHELASVMGRVRDAQGLPVAGVTMRCFYKQVLPDALPCGLMLAQTETDEQGSFTLNDVFAGTEVEIKSEGRDEICMRAGPVVLEPGEVRELPEMLWRSSAEDGRIPEGY